MERGKILIYRVGSMGDTVVSLPVFHLIAKRYPRARRFVLTNHPDSGKAIHMSSLLNNTGLIHGYFSYPTGTRNLKEIQKVRRQIKSWNPDLLVYLAEPRGLLSCLRDLIFFKLCGVKNIIGLPFKKDKRHHRSLLHGNMWESEASRLARCVNTIGDADIENPENWQLNFTHQEQCEADKAICNWDGLNKFISCSIGTKCDVKDWGFSNWEIVINAIVGKYPKLGIVMLGSENDYERSQELLLQWKGPKLNLCGKTAPRISAIIIEKSIMFLGHDGGPMHLAAAVGTPCVAVFSARNKPGVWFPFGNNHHIFYHQMACYGCGLNKCLENNKMCIKAINPQEVIDAVEKLLFKVCYFLN